MILLYIIGIKPITTPNTFQASWGMRHAPFSFLFNLSITSVRVDELVENQMGSSHIDEGGDPGLNFNEIFNQFKVVWMGKYVIVPFI